MVNLGRVGLRGVRSVGTRKVANRWRKTQMHVLYVRTVRENKTGSFSRYGILYAVEKVLHSVISFKESPSVKHDSPCQAVHCRTGRREVGGQQQRLASHKANNFYCMLVEDVMYVVLLEK